MKRSNESFKNEVFRRYNVEKRNRRNLRIYAATTLMLFILAVGVLLPMVSGTALGEMVAAMIDNSPLKPYLNQEIDQILMEKNCPGVIREVTEEDTIRTIKQALRKLELTESPVPFNPMRSDRDPEWAFDLTFRNMDETRFLIAIDQQYLIVFEGNENFTVPENGTWYALSAGDAKQLYSALNKIYAEDSKMHGLKREINESAFFTSTEINAAMDAALEGWEDFYWPDKYLATLRYADDIFAAAYEAEYKVESDAIPDLFGDASPEVIYFYCEFNRIFNPNPQPIQSYLRAEKQNGQWVFTDFFQHWSYYFGNNPFDDDDFLDADIFRSYLDQPIDLIRYQFIPDDLIYRGTESESEINDIVAKLKQLSLTAEPNIELDTSGPNLELHLEDGRLIQLKLDSDGWMRFILRDAENKILQSQWYSLPTSNVESIRQYLNGLMPPETSEPPATEYPTLEDLLTFLTPTANAMYVYPSPASSIRCEYSGTGEEIAHVLTSLRNMAPALDSTSLPTDPPDMTIDVEWVLDEYSAIVRLAPDSGLIRYYLLSPDGEQLTTTLYSAPAADVAALAEYVEGLMTPPETSDPPVTSP